MKLMTENQLKEAMSSLLNELEKSESKITDKQIIGKAVALGMNYQESKIRSGIDIVFDELHKKNI